MSEPSPHSPKRRGRLLRAAGALVVLLAVAAYMAVQYVTGGRGGPGCEVVAGDAEGDGTTYEFTPEQAVNAATIAAVGTGRGMPERAVTIALATALQESALRNIAHGDRDSLGLFQQRPSQGWGTAKEIMDPTYAAGEFYRHLAKVDDYAELPLTVAAQRVQRSGFPEAYAKHEPDAALLAAALTGNAAATLSCTGTPAPVASVDPTAGETQGPDAVRAALARDFGRDALQPVGAEVGTAAEPSAAPSQSTGGSRVLTLPVTAGSSPAKGRTDRQRGWQLAQWAVANASALRIERVVYAGREWTAGNVDSRWRTVRGAGTGGTGGTGGTAGAADTVRIVTARP
ncbi:heavy metal transporter [Streptomyces sp. DSM 41014]|uniref:Heavy metal transporter n=1 Tax=Streptomyces hintoniae TaxID=3075521 RepID=A0ABU2USS9_9ACTN|nr:heavy metal transporter [Streptomyces sp. DSM 41014]MDT0476343.1 heavy metal transporter [Streptomyces sp. DSM 41014]